MPCKILVYRTRGETPSKNEWAIVYHFKVWISTLFIHSFYRGRLSHDHHIWATLPGLRREICTGCQWPYMWPPVVLMVVENIKCIWYLATTSTTNSQNLIVHIWSPQVTAGRRRLDQRSIGDQYDLAMIKPRLGSRWPQVTAGDRRSIRLSHD